MANVIFIFILENYILAKSFIFCLCIEHHVLKKYEGQFLEHVTLDVQTVLTETFPGKAALLKNSDDTTRYNSGS